MKKGTGLFLIVSLLVLILIIVVVKSYSSLSSLKEDTINKEADINVQINKKIEQISSLIEMKKEIIEEDKYNIISSTLSELKKIEGIKDKSKLNDDLTEELNSVLDIINANEEIKNMEEVKTKINEIISTEKRIETAKDNYNEIVEKYNSKVNHFPSNIIASILGHKTKDVFEQKNKIKNIYEG